MQVGCKQSGCVCLEILQTPSYSFNGYGSPWKWRESLEFQTMQLYISQMLNVWNICLHLGSNLCTFVGKYSSAIWRIWGKGSCAWALRGELNTLSFLVKYPAFRQNKKKPPIHWLHFLKTNVFASENGCLEDDCFLSWYGLFSERGLWV